MKIKNTHAVPLTVEMMEILKRRSAEAKRGEKLVFPASLSSTDHITEKSGKGSFWWRITERAGLRTTQNMRVSLFTIYDEPSPVGASCVAAASYFKVQIPSMLLGHCHLSLGRADQSSKQELTRVSITASTYAHLDVEPSRIEE